MNKLIKLIFLTLIILTILVPPVFALQYPDVPSDHWAYNSIQKLVDLGIFEDSPIQGFEGKSLVNKYQLAVVGVRMVEKTLDYSIPIAEAPIYPDVPSYHYAYPSIQKLIYLRLLDPLAEIQFKGEEKINRSALASFLCGIIEKTLLPPEEKLTPADPDSGYKDVPSYHYAYSSIQKLIAQGVLPGRKENTFEGEKEVNRYTLAALIARVFDIELVKELGKGIVKKKKRITKKVEVEERIKRRYIRILGKKIEVKEEGVEEEVIEVPMYRDVSLRHPAYSAVAELIEAGILRGGRTLEFKGEEPIDRYQLFYFICKIVEKIVMGEVGELKLASPTLAYWDVPTRHPFYSSIQKLISLGILPGEVEGRLDGNKLINRYEMAHYFLFSIEEVLKDHIKIPEADITSRYGDVPQDHYAYSSIQKLIWLGVLPGGLENSFQGQSEVTRFKLAEFMVKTLKAIYLKLEEIKYEIVEEVRLPFDVFSVTSLGVYNYQNLTNLYAQQAVRVSISQSINREVSAYIALGTIHYFGAAADALSLSESYILYTHKPFLVQAGRQGYFHSYSPFGTSLFANTMSDLVLFQYQDQSYAITSCIGKLSYYGDVTQDSNYGSLLMNFDIRPAEVSVGGAILTDILGPYTSRVQLLYGGFLVRPTHFLDFSAEYAHLDYSNPQDLDWIGYSPAITDTTAFQAALTYYWSTSKLSIGYQKIGDDFYLGGLTSPLSSIGNIQGTEAYITKFSYSPLRTWWVGADVGGTTQGGKFISTGVCLSTQYRLFPSTYLSASLSRIFALVSPGSDLLSGVVSLTLSF